MRASLALAALLLAAPAAAGGLQVPCVVTRPIDGDSFGASCAIWPGVTAETVVRVAGVDAAELRARCDAERTLALAARDYVAAWTGAAVTLTEIEHGKYAGRVVARVTAGERDLAAELLAAGLAVPYDGGARQGWCP